MGRKEKATPKTYQVRISTNALQNIDEITGYIAFINHQPLNYLPKLKCTALQPVTPGPLYLK